MEGYGIGLYATRIFSKKWKAAWYVCHVQDSLDVINIWCLSRWWLMGYFSSLCHHHTYNERPKPKVVLVLVIWISQITSNAITTRGLEYYFWRTVIFFCGCPRPLPRIRGFYNFHFSIGSIHQMKRQIATQHLLGIPFLVWILWLMLLSVSGASIVKNATSKFCLFISELPSQEIKYILFYKVQV